MFWPSDYDIIRIMNKCIAEGLIWHKSIPSSVSLKYQDMYTQL